MFQTRNKADSSVVNTKFTKSDIVKIEGSNQVMNVSRNKIAEYVGDKTVRETDKQ
jgi:hypothetical protein